ncbi:hypothetical protein M8C21_031711 [Ambrosia artemisiifolia]|uniref:NB-ARC domain-containing protein n=1 Tax=Ambrosia artemisiifolia TaxID=4212 RepID=A0AAD5BS19_AMBAR|nr:hypothetical protein M8C21_031711 [Ambrosia artemisiifolia]
MADALDHCTKQSIKPHEIFDLSVEELLALIKELLAYEGKALVGFDNEIETLLDQLIGTCSTKQFQIISVTGMAGLGKTTLARALYNHELVWFTLINVVLSFGARKISSRGWIDQHRHIKIFLKILDLESILISLFPLDIVQMINLRYLAIRAHDGSPHASVSNLVNLQMLIVSSRKNMVIPKTIWKMLNLRHLYIKSGENSLEDASFLQVTGNDGPSALASFQTLSQVNPRSCHNIFSRTPNLRKLGFCGPLISRLGDMQFPCLGSLEHLQKLKLLNTFPYSEATRSCNPVMFLENLKKLTLSNTGMDWEEMWSFSLLPNLEILKLKLQAFVGEI